MRNSRFTSTRVVVRSVPQGHDARALAQSLGVIVTSATPLADVEILTRDKLATIEEVIANAPDVANLQEEIDEQHTEIEALKADCTTHENNADTAREIAATIFGVLCAVVGVQLPTPIAAPAPVMAKRTRTRKAA